MNYYLEVNTFTYLSEKCKYKYLIGANVEKLFIDKGEPEVNPNYYQGSLFR